LPLIFAKAVL